MACLRVTLLKARPGATEEAQRLLEELDEALCDSDGLVLSFVAQMEAGRYGRIALWHTKEDANREAVRDHILALRSRLRHLSLDTQEVLMDVRSGHIPRELITHLAGDLDTAERAAMAGA